MAVAVGLLTLQIYLNDLDVSGDYIERLMEDISSNLPQVFVETDIPTVQEELKALGAMSTRFRNASKVGHRRLLRRVIRRSRTIS